MSAALPANRVHLVLAGLPQRNAEPLALNICAALQFAANTFPEFQAFIQTDDLGGDGFPDGFRSALADLTPEFLAQIADMVTAGVVADQSGGVRVSDDDLDDDLTVTLGSDPSTGHPVTFRAKISDRDNPYLGWRRVEPVDGYIDVPAQWVERP